MSTGPFAQISVQVATFFEILESDTPGVGKASLAHSTRPRPISCARSHISWSGRQSSLQIPLESQLNSFGLSVFLASVLQFNPEFHFILLDDVVNSLDAYKRPRLIQILKQYFQDKQVLLLTHDSVWRDRLTKELPGWKRLHFKRHEIGTGPIMVAPETTLEQVEALILNDDPRQAGQLLGPLMEDEIQDACEAFEAEVKFNRRNEYTLEPLVTALKGRVDAKLKVTHPLAAALAALSSETGFRNLCAHAKNLDVDITPQEMTDVVAKWKAVASRLRCGADPACTQLVRWVDPQFRCGCGKTVLSKA